MLCLEWRCHYQCHIRVTFLSTEKLSQSKHQLAMRVFLCLFWPDSCSLPLSFPPCSSIIWSIDICLKSLSFIKTAVSGWILLSTRVWLQILLCFRFFFSFIPAAWTSSCCCFSCFRRSSSFCRSYSYFNSRSRSSRAPDTQNEHLCNTTRYILSMVQMTVADDRGHEIPRHL